jgi:predicted transcriptional regulator
MLSAEGQAMSTAKQDVQMLLHKLPDNCSVEDIQYHLYVLDKVRRGLEEARENGSLPQEEVESHLSKWLTE